MINESTDLDNTNEQQEKLIEPKNMTRAQLEAFIEQVISKKYVLIDLECADRLVSEQLKAPLDHS